MLFLPYVRAAFSVLRSLPRHVYESGQFLYDIWYTPRKENPFLRKKKKKRTQEQGEADAQQAEAKKQMNSDAANDAVRLAKHHMYGAKDFDRAERLFNKVYAPTSDLQVQPCLRMCHNPVHRRSSWTPVSCHKLSKR